MSFEIQCRRCGNRIRFSRSISASVTCPGCGSKIEAGDSFSDPFASTKGADDHDSLDATDSTPTKPSAENPYVPSKAFTHHAERAKDNPLFLPGVCLVILSGAWFLIQLIWAILQVFKFSLGIPLVEEVEDLGRMNESTFLIVFLSSSLLGLIIQGTIIAGGIAMIRLRQRGLVVTACLLALIPCCSSPFVILGMPFAIWGLNAHKRVHISR